MAWVEGEAKLAVRTVRVWSMMVLFLFEVLVGGVQAAPSPAAPPSLTAASAILMDWETGKVLYEKQARQRRDPASTTKVLTALIVLERANLADTVKISRKAAFTPGSSMYLRVDEVHSIHDLLHGLLLRSGNDAAVALAEHVAGSVEAFAHLMNERAKQAGAQQSHFVNPHGLTDANHYSTAYDLALITRAALMSPQFTSIVALRESTLSYQHEGRDVVLHNTNALLKMLPDADGVKTGTTDAAGPCLIASATRDEQKLVAVVLRSSARWSDSSRLLEWGFGQFRLARFGRAGEVLLSQSVKGGTTRLVPLVLSEHLSAVLPRQGERLPEVKVEIFPKIQAPLQRGQRLGKATVWADGQMLANVPLVAGQAVAERSWWEAIVQELTRLLTLTGPVGSGRAKIAKVLAQRVVSHAAMASTW